MNEVFSILKCSQKGLTSEQAKARVIMFGLNKLEEKKVIMDPLLFIFFSFCFLFYVLSPNFKTKRNTNTSKKNTQVVKDIIY